ncbi:MAG: hypothetical protein JXR37_15045 [Kiritimatiellae bacterium]|nr:hypothetical protein [Kiritimatiellia bacterium]
MSDDSAPRRPMPDHDAWPEFALPWDDTSSGPADMSRLLHKPAGAAGFVGIRDGHLCTGDGVRWRIWGQNLCFNAMLPAQDMAPTVARRLAKFGINCVRLHHMDHRWPRGVLIRSLVPRDQRDGRESGAAEHTRALDPEALARLDYFVFCCRANGVYVDLNLNVSRPFTAADGVKQADWIGYGKALTYFDPQLILLQKEYAQQLLGHVNPFTGNRYADEPAVALVELVNENSILESWLCNRLRGEQTEPARRTWCDIPPAYADDLDRRWNGWLAARYGTRAALAAAWNGGLAEREDAAQGSVRRLRPEEFAPAPARRFADEATFYAGLERTFYEDMAGYLRNELGVKQVIVGTSDHNHGLNGQLHVKSNAVLGIVDTHMYWQHPRFPSAAWSRKDWLITNTAMVDAPDHSAPARLSRGRVRGLPYILSEINEPFPNDYAAEFIPTLAAYGLLQDWDGFFFFAYGHSAERWKDGGVMGYFDMANDPVKMTQLALGALVFLRGDVGAARECVERRLTAAHVCESLRTNKPDDRHPYSIPYLLGRLALVHRTVIAEFEAETLAPAEQAVPLPEGTIVSDTGELCWEDAAEDGRVLVNAARYQAFVGRRGECASANMTFDLYTPFAAVQLASLDDAPIAEARLLLLAAGARVANTGMRWTDETRRSLGENWGQAPTRIEPVCGTLTLGGLAGATGVVLRPLDPCGQPVGPGTEAAAADGRFRLELTEENASPWYLVEVRRG